MTFEETYTGLRAELIRYAQKILYDQGVHDDAEDLVQSVFAEYWLRYLNNSEIRDVKSYLYSWTRHECIRILRKVSRSRLLQQDLENIYQSLYDSESVAHVADFNRIKRAFSQLSPKQRLVLHLYAEKSWRRKRIAAELQLSEFTVKAHLAAARKNLRNYMQVSAA